MKYSKMKEKENLKVSTVSTTSPTVEVSTNQQQQKVAKFKDDFIDAPNLTEEQRQQLGHASYIEKAPEFVRSKAKELITLQGITTSQVQQALKADNPYPARVFLKADNQEEDIPVFFRMKDGDNWVRPKIKMGSYLEVQGNFSVGTVYTKNSERKSFTATDYQILQEPKPLNTADLITLTSGLLTATLEKYKEWTNRKDFLFKKLDELKEIATLAKLGENFLQAYLTLKKAQYANYQTKLLNSNFNLTHYLETISTEIQLVKSHIEAYQSKQISHGK